jgi:hypothetical protein
LPSLAVIVVLAFATFRLARLIAVDSISLALRERVYRFAYAEDGELPPVPRAPWRTWVYDLVTCVHCLGVWLAVAVYCAWRWGGDVAFAILTVAAIAGAQSALASFTTKADA